MVRQKEKKPEKGESRVMKFIKEQSEEEKEEEDKKEEESEGSDN